MISHKKTKLLQKVTVLALLLCLVQNSLSLAYDATFKTGIGTNSIMDLNTYRQNTDTSTTKLNASAKITNSRARINLSLRDSDIQQVLRMFADKAGVNIVFHSSVTGKVSLDLVNTTLNDAFMLVLDTSGLTYFQDNNTVIVATKEEAPKMSFARQNLTVLPVKYVDATNVANFLNSNVFSAKITGLSNEKIVTVNPRTNEIMIFGSRNDVDIAKRIIDKLDTRPMINTFKVNHTTPKEMATLLCSSIMGVEPGGGDEGGAKNVGGAGGASKIYSSNDFTSGAETGAAVGQSTVSEITLGGGVIACKSGDMDSASEPAASENEIAYAPFAAVPMNIAYFSQLGTVSVYGGSVQQVQVIRDFIEKNDKKQPMAYLEMSIIELNEVGSKEFNNNWTLETPITSFTFGSEGRTTSTDMKIFSNDKFSNRKFFPKDYIWNQEWAKDVQRWLPGRYDSTTGEWIAGKWVDDPQPLGLNTRLKYSLDVAITSGNGRLLANPKLMVTNGQKSIIDLSADYVKSVKTEITSGNGMTVTTKTVEIGDDEGLKIEIMPFISLDGYVTLNMAPHYATIKGDFGDSNGDLLATLLQRRDLQLNNLRIKDGETLILGGMIREEERQKVSKIPFFGDLPLIGVMFRNTSNQKEKAELIIMITPHIVYDDEQIADMKKENL